MRVAFKTGIVFSKRIRLLGAEPNEFYVPGDLSVTHAHEFRYF